MKRVSSFLAASVLFLVTCAGAGQYSRKNIYDNKEAMIYYNTDLRNSCKTALGWVLEEDSIPVFGSSELSSSDDVAYPPALFEKGNSDFNMVLVGEGYMQSLHHAVTLGGTADAIPGKKVVLILSPQWFTSSHLSSEVYASRFSERMFSRFLRNSSLSYDTKEKVINRMKTLLAADSRQLERLENYENVYLKHSLNPISQIEVRGYDAFMDYRQMYLLGREMKSLKKTENGAFASKTSVTADRIDFKALMEKAEEAGEKACTNNTLFINDGYYDQYIRDREKDAKGSNEDASYLSSPEYEDLGIFLQVCRETGITPLIVSIPVNGRWYDWTGFPREDRKGYYENIREICQEYQVELADFSDKEYEKYFLKDIMHLGWKGWVYLDEAVYEFYKK